MSKICVLVIAGPSAAGKTTVMQKIVSLSGGKFELARSLTTRPKRGDGFDSEYLYTNRVDFEKELSFGRILEYTEYSGELYGTPLFELERIVKDGKIPLLILDLNGVKSVAKSSAILEMCAIYLYCDNETLQKRLFSRYISGGYSEEAELKMKSRLKQNLEDFAIIPKMSECFYAFVENNDQVAFAAKKILEIFSDFLSGKGKKQEENMWALEKISKAFDFN